MDWGPDGHLYVSSQRTDRVLEYRYDVETQTCPFVGVFAVGGGVDSPTYIAFADLGNDCNRNGSPDDCDIADGRERDRDGNGMPDSCEPCVRNPAWVCDGDVDGNGAVNPVDVGLVQAAFCSLQDCTPADLCQYDLDCNGAINPVDSGIVQLLYGSCDPPRDVCP
jgi:hypothetical protein